MSNVSKATSTGSIETMLAEWCWPSEEWELVMRKELGKLLEFFITADDASDRLQVELSETHSAQPCLEPGVLEVRFPLSDMNDVKATISLRTLVAELVEFNQWEGRAIAPDERTTLEVTNKNFAALASELRSLADLVETAIVKFEE